MDSKELSRSWFCVLNNPQEVYSGEPHEIAHHALDAWVTDQPTRTGAVAYCISADGLIHLHMVLEDSNKARFSALKKTYPKAHLEPTKGNKQQAEDYINKRGKFAEKGEQVIYIAQFGEIKGNQGQRRDIEIIQELLEQGKTPNEIFENNLGYRRYEKMVRDHYYQNRARNTPALRDVKVCWHTGETGTGKSYIRILKIEEYGEDDVYVVSDFKNGFDKYNGEKVIILDEFKGQMPYYLLLMILDKYKIQVPCRYTNVYSLWSEVHITAKVPLENVYKSMVESDRNIDTIDQLKRRIHEMVYHYKDGEEFKSHAVPMSEYRDYETLKRSVDVVPDWVRQTEQEDGQLPF
ncbi:MAG: hypothetical protein LBI19_03220 [Oscillospiraceae bacterium]|jgi:hypothetical protein|nr:hypothetical protein [Oscillospiraceae bacterium]